MSEVDAILKKIEGSDDIIGCALASRDGLPAGAKFHQAHDPQTLSAMAAATLAAGETAVIGLENEGVDRVLIQGKTTHTLIQGISEQHLLIIVASDRLPVDELIEHAESASKDLKVLHAE